MNEVSYVVVFPNVFSKNKIPQLIKNIKKILKIKNQKYNFTIASIGTDGIDGNTKFAGALFSTEYEHDGKPYLKNNDSSSFFKKYGGLIKTGITQNNVNDIGVILRRN